MSSRVVQGSQASPLDRVLATNSTDTSFASRADTLTEPTGDGIVELAVGLNRTTAATWLRVHPIGIGSANTTMKVRVNGVAAILDANGAVVSYTFVPLLSFTATLGAKTGIASGGVLDTEKYADTIDSILIGDANVSYRVSSPADDTAAFILIDMSGFQKAALDFDKNSSATSCNALAAQV